MVLYKLNLRGFPSGTISSDPNVCPVGCICFEEKSKSQVEVLVSVFKEELIAAVYPICC